MRLSIPAIEWSDLIAVGPPKVTRSCPLIGPVAAVVAAIESVIGRRADAPTRAVPSAGAIYPYEIILATPGLDSYALLDLERRRLIVSEANHFPLDLAEYAILIFGRPWFSIRKYGPRGYLYHLIDIGHAIHNLALIGDQEAWSDEIDWSIDHARRRPTAIGLVAAASCPAIHSGWVLARTSSAQPGSRRDGMEQYVEQACPPPPPVPVVFNRVTPYPATRTDVLARHSAAGFTGSDDLAASAEAAKIYRSCRTASERSAEQADLCLPYTTITDFSELSEHVEIRTGLEAGLGGQTHLSEAAAYVVFGVSTTPDSTTVGPRFQQRALATGMLGQSLYLGATVSGLGVTGVGGIYPNFWNQFLTVDQQAIYLVAFGRELTGSKYDAMPTYSCH